MINETDYINNPLTKEQENQIDSLFAQYDNQNTPGCSVGVIRDGRFIYKKSFGMADLENDIPITVNSKFEIGSVSKQFTATGIALLAIEEQLDLDDDVRKYIPELPDYGKSITIRHLLHHTSGIRDYVQLFLFSDSINQFENHLNNDSLEIILKQKELNFPPGKKHLYSNSGYLLLREIIEIVSGMSHQKFI
ncbi:MAG: serine hydrolase, partial [Candidatus Delongbacteria bacterium]|nr:serine hydrolase [Candidatus Delongbacteria bacterium]